MKTLFQVSRLFIALFLIASCKKEVSNPNTYIDTYYRDFFFKEGTYWVYENNITHEIDSQYVHEAQHHFKKLYNPKNNSYYEYYENTIHNYINGNIYEAKITVSGVFINLYGFLYCYSPAVQWVGLSNEHDLSSYIGSLIQTTISGNVFKNVFRNFIPKENQWGNQLYYDTEFWVAPKYGIIKRIEYDTPNGTVEWNLVRWKIIL